MGPQRQCRPLIYILFIPLTFFCTFSGVLKPSNGDPQEIPNSDPVFSFLVQISDVLLYVLNEFWGSVKIYDDSEKEQAFLNRFHFILTCFWGHFSSKRMTVYPQNGLARVSKKSQIVDPTFTSETCFLDPRPKLGHFLDPFLTETCMKSSRNRGPKSDPKDDGFSLSLEVQIWSFQMVKKLPTICFRKNINFQEFDKNLRFL